jgi:hypothetical protein
MIEGKEPVEIRIMRGKIDDLAREMDEDECPPPSERAVAKFFECYGALLNHMEHLVIPASVTLENRMFFPILTSGGFGDIRCRWGYGKKSVVVLILPDGIASVYCVTRVDGDPQIVTTNDAAPEDFVKGWEFVWGSEGAGS